MTMKPLSIKICLLLGLLISATSVFSRPSLNNLDIKVVLSKNGDARITETREMYIDDEGTECYIGLANMGESQVKDLTVSDETGTRFINVDWDVDETRDWKTYKCGQTVVTKCAGVWVRKANEPTSPVIPSQVWCAAILMPTLSVMCSWIHRFRPNPTMPRSPS